MAGAFFMLVNFALVNFLRGIGDTRTPMYFTLGVNILNAVLNYALVLGNWGVPRMGASGAALASVLATAVFSAAYLAFFLTGERQRRFQTRRIRLATIDEILPFFKIGAPIGAVWALEMVSWTFFQSVVSHLGNAELAATIIVFQVLHFSFMGAVSLGAAATALVGQYLGAEDPKTAGKTALTTIRWGVAYCMALGLVFYAGRYEITAFFSDDPAVIEIGGRLFIYAAVFQFFDGLGISSNGVIRGAGDTRWPMILMVILAWGVFAPLTYLLAFPAGLGIDGAWIAVVIFIAANGIGLHFRRRSGKWLAMRV
jgi:putative MATE family efflux protein